jgi:hypothetical protein
MALIYSQAVATYKSITAGRNSRQSKAYFEDNVLLARGIDARVTFTLICMCM